MNAELTNKDIAKIEMPDISSRLNDPYWWHKAVAKTAQRKLVEWLSDRMCHISEGDLFTKEGTKWIFSGHCPEDTYCINSTIWRELRKAVGL